jgi:copper chaperone CopZ
MNITIKIVAVTVLLFSLTFCNAQINHAKTETVKIFGNCEMCESTIETAGNVKKIAKVDWNKDSKMAIITYDSTKTNQDDILKRIALAGYDNNKFLAPNDVYNKLAECCQYKRSNKTEIRTVKHVDNEVVGSEINLNETKQETNQLKVVFDKYFALKDAFVKSDGKLASQLASELLILINAVKMDKLLHEEHVVWMKIVSSLKLNAEKIKATTNIDKQRTVFMDLSANFYDLVKVSKQAMPVYYQHCPMYNDGKGANWLSKENAVKNPYYGSQMLTCGKTVEVVK